MTGRERERCGDDCRLRDMMDFWHAWDLESVRLVGCHGVQRDQMYQSNICSSRRRIGTV